MNSYTYIADRTIVDLYTDFIIWETDFKRQKQGEVTGSTDLPGNRQRIKVNAK